MKQFEKTYRKGIDVKYQCTKRKKPKVKIITAQLYLRGLNDSHEMIGGARASYTMKEHETEDEAQKVALNRAMQKLDANIADQQKKETQNQDKKESHYFSKRWNKLGREKASLVSDTHRSGEEYK